MSILMEMLLWLVVDTKEAGVGELEVVCEAMGEKRVRIPVDIREDGHTYRVRMRATVPAHYRIYVNYGGELVLRLLWCELTMLVI